ncbi:MAG: hypothetical protein FWF44_08375, partial [Defluviitaleaceae bacterium]|nr:hypothetical protein [Defluviitaleaceae bacterium]
SKTINNSASDLSTTDVTWSVFGSSANSGTSIDPMTGVLTVGGNETATALNVRATSVADSRASAGAIVTIVSPQADFNTNDGRPTIWFVKSDGTYFGYNGIANGKLGPTQAINYPSADLRIIVDPGVIVNAGAVTAKKLEFDGPGMLTCTTTSGTTINIDSGDNTGAGLLKVTGGTLKCVDTNNDAWGFLVYGQIQVTGGLLEGHGNVGGGVPNMGSLGVGGIAVTGGAMRGFGTVSNGIRSPLNPISVSGTGKMEAYSWSDAIFLTSANLTVSDSGSVFAQCTAGAAGVFGVNTTGSVAVTDSGALVADPGAGNQAFNASSITGTQCAVSSLPDAGSYTNLSAAVVALSGGSQAGAQPTVTNVTVNPSTASVAAGNTKQFSANVTVANGAATTVSWSVSGGSNSSIDPTSGVLAVGSAETAGTILTVKATSTADTSKSGTAAVTVTASSGDTRPTVEFTNSNGTYTSYNCSVATLGAPASGQGILTGGGQVSGTTSFDYPNATLHIIVDSGVAINMGTINATNIEFTGPGTLTCTNSTGFSEAIGMKAANSQLTVTSGKLTGKATSGGWAIWVAGTINVTGGELDGTSTSGCGIGIPNASGSLTVSGSGIVNASATTGFGLRVPTDPVTVKDNGKIYAYGGGAAAIDDVSNLTVQDNGVVFAQNTVSGPAVIASTNNAGNGLGQINVLGNGVLVMVPGGSSQPYIAQTATYSASYNPVPSGVYAGAPAGATALTGK